MAGYSRITCYIPGFENASSEEELRSLYSAFLHDFYDSDAPDTDYFETLERYGLGVWGFAFANVESLDVAACVAALTLMVSADRLGDGFGEPKACISDIGLFLRLLRRIAELDGTWQRPNVVTFYHEGEENGYLSNWYEAPFEFAGITFPTAEHWMMWHKARLFRDADTAEKILVSTDLDEVKALGKQVKPYADELWEEVRVPIMRVGLRQKFLQNERLYHELLSTGMAALAEAAANDATWGIGIGRDDPRAADPGQWRGRNLMGITLMGVRSDLRAACPWAARPSWSVDDLRQSQLWDMSLLELARVPSCRPAAIMYATYAAFAVPGYHGARDALRRIEGTVGEICESMGSDMGGGLPADGWRELTDELAFQASLTRTEPIAGDGKGYRARGGMGGSRRVDIDELNALEACQY